MKPQPILTPKIRFSCVQYHAYFMPSIYCSIVFRVLVHFCHSPHALPEQNLQSNLETWFKIWALLIRLSQKYFDKIQRGKDALQQSMTVTSSKVFFRSSPQEFFLGKGVLKIRRKFAGEHPSRSVISIKLQCNFIEITLWHGCSPVNLLLIFKTSFLITPLEGCFILVLFICLRFHSVL